MLKSCRQSRGNMTEQDTEVVQQTTSLKKIQITVTHWKAFDNLHSSAELQSVCHWGNVWERPTCCHAWIYPVPYLSCGPYVYVPSLCTCLYACGSLKKQNSITILKQTHMYWQVQYKNRLFFIALLFLYTHRFKKCPNTHNLQFCQTDCKH